jgi:DNA repair exonuclease SbcCD ATPase subunit
MHVRSLTLRGFTSHADTTVSLPARGTIVVTGPNGGGKSSLIEAPAFGTFGETLRGTPPWTGKKGELVVNVDCGLPYKITRTFDGRRVMVSIGDGEFSTPTKMQPTLNGIFGSWDVWRRSHVFSSQDASHFTLSKDSDRKRLLESLLGLERFDTAHESCKAERDALQKELSRAEFDMAQLVGRKQSALLRLQDAEREMAEQLPPEPHCPERSLEDLNAEVRQIESRLCELGGAMSDLSLREGSARGKSDAINREMGTARSELQRLQSMGLCPICERELPPARIEKAQAVVKSAEGRAVSAATDNSAKLHRIHCEREELNRELDALQSRKVALEVQRGIASCHASWQERCRQVETTVQRRKEFMGKLQREVAELDGQIALDFDMESLRERLVVLNTATSVLSLGGVRSHLLAGALDSIEAVANGWLARIAGPKMRLKLSPYSENSKGGVKDAISLEITGAGNGYGYKASSGGERRRIDVSLLLALGEVAAGARGITPGTIFADEVFDALDEPGTEAVVDVLRELSQDRAVVVISHDEKLIRRLPEAVHWHVENGKVTQL